jgi:hypothetical protein
MATIPGAVGCGRFGHLSERLLGPEASGLGTDEQRTQASLMPGGARKVQPLMNSTASAMTNEGATRVIRPFQLQAPKHNRQTPAQWRPSGPSAYHFRNQVGCTWVPFTHVFHQWSPF